jgi:rhamnulokinase
MSTSATYLAFDLGASSGRAVVGTLVGEGDAARMTTREVHRFRTPLVDEAGHLRWDHEALWAEVRAGLARALEVAPELRSVSVDSWAVDYVPLGADGEPLRKPYAYRDPRVRGRLDAFAECFGADALYARTGIQFLPFNTLPQVLADVDEEPELVARTATRLLIADWLLHRFSGVAVCERTMASTTQLMDAHTGAWSEALIRAAGDDPGRWPPIVAPGTVLGPVRPELVSDGAAPAVVASCSHDTAAAVAAVPARGDRPWAYVSSGTWSLVGAELAAPVLTPEARAAGFTNEAGLDGTIRFLKNRTGMWVLEECVREWGEAGERPSWETLSAEAAAAPRAGDTIDLDAPAFGERGGMPAKVHAACRARGIALGGQRGALVRLVLESLAAGYRRTLDELESLTGERAEVVHVVGGGARNDLLNQLTADACGRPVVAGPEEATVLGNLLVQARALGDLPAGASVRDVARRSARLTEFTPRGGERAATNAIPATPAAASALRPLTHSSR